MYIPSENINIEVDQNNDYTRAKTVKDLIILLKQIYNVKQNVC